MHSIHSASGGTSKSNTHVNALSPVHASDPSELSQLPFRLKLTLLEMVFELPLIAIYPELREIECDLNLFLNSAGRF